MNNYEFTTYNNPLDALNDPDWINYNTLSLEEWYEPIALMPISDESENNNNKYED